MILNFHTLSLPFWNGADKKGLLRVGLFYWREKAVTLRKSDSIKFKILRLRSE
jgi:hypothetical protein